MTTRLGGLVPILALLGMGTAQAQVGNQTGSMAYPQSNPSGQVQIPAPTARDTGNMAFPSSPGGVAVNSPQGADTGNMAVPTGRGILRRGGMAARPVAARGGDPANSMRPDVAPTPARTGAAQSLDSAPSTGPVPYTDFLPPDRPAGRGMMMRGRAAGHHVAMHGKMKPKMKMKAKAAASAPPAAAATPAAPAAAK